MAGISSWKAGTTHFPLGATFVFVAGLVLGLVGLGSLATQFTRRASAHADNPLVLSSIVAIGVGAHNLGEGLAIGASAASGATAIAVALIVGFALHNATEGFGVAAPLVGRYVPSWSQIGLAGLIAGGPTFLGTIIGYTFYSPTLSVLFLSIAIGALVFVIGELWAVLRKTGLTPFVTIAVSAGFIIAMATELFLDYNHGVSVAPKTFTAISQVAERAGMKMLAGGCFSGVFNRRSRRGSCLARRIFARARVGCRSRSRLGGKRPPYAPRFPMRHISRSRPELAPTHLRLRCSLRLV